MRTTAIRQSEIRSEAPILIPGIGLVSGCIGNGKLDKELRYSVPLTKYESYSYQCGEDEHHLCHKCYDKVHNRARFGLCNECFNSSEMTTLMVSDAREGKVYLTRRGRRVCLVGPMVRIPVWAGNKIASYRMKMIRPYIFADRPLRRRDFDLQLSNERMMKLKAHGIIPMDYLLAELD